MTDRNQQPSQPSQTKPNGQITTSQFSYPFTSSQETLVAQPNSSSGTTTDPNSPFHHADERWKFTGIKSRKASAPASDVGEHARASSIDDREMFKELMEKTQGMTPEEVREYLEKRPQRDGGAMMRGKKGEGYGMLAGAFGGTM